VKLNLGCGTDIRTGYLNLDRANLPGVDLVWDIMVFPLPFDDCSADEILCYSVLEHVDYVPLLRELYRILRKSGSLRIEVPHFTSVAMYTDPTHRNFFGCGTFDFFVKGGPRPYYFDFAFETLKQKLTFPKRKIFLLNAPIERLVNRSKWWQEVYESSGLRGLFPANAIEIVLEK
jgi:SAM-dependent methyltransferase